MYFLRRGSPWTKRAVKPASAATSTKPTGKGRPENFGFGCAGRLAVAMPCGNNAGEASSKQTMNREAITNETSLGIAVATPQGRNCIEAGNG
jgi:hypothetical protein